MSRFYKHSTEPEIVHSAVRVIIKWMLDKDIVGANSNGMGLKGRTDRYRPSDEGVVLGFVSRYYVTLVENDFENDNKKV